MLTKLNDLIVCDEAGEPGDKGASGAESTDTPDNGSGSQTDMVAYETHRRLLSEKKTLQAKHAETNARLAELEAERESAEKAKMEEQGKYKELLELERKKAQEAIDKATSLEERQLNAVKVNAFLNALDGNVKPAYYGHIPVDKIKLDATTGEVDEMSVTEVVKSFKQEYPEIVVKQTTTTGIPSTAPDTSGVGGKISHEEWTKLPVDEMKKRLPDVIKEN